MRYADDGSFAVYLAEDLRAAVRQFSIPVSYVCTSYVLELCEKLVLAKGDPEKMLSIYENLPEKTPGKKSPTTISVPEGFALLVNNLKISQQQIDSICRDALMDELRKQVRIRKNIKNDPRFAGCFST